MTLIKQIISAVVIAGKAFAILIFCYGCAGTVHVTVYRHAGSGVVNT